MFDLKRLRYFCAVVEHGSISHAAIALNMAQPPLSKRLQELEEEVGVTLLTRGARRVVPTQAGSFLYQRCCEVFRLLEDARNRVLDIANSESRTIKIGVSYLFKRYFFPLIRDLRLRFPDVDISVSTSDSSHLEYLLQKQLIDVAFIQRPRGLDGYETTDFPPVGIAALVARGLTPNDQDVMSLAELGDFPLILLQRVEGVSASTVVLEHFRNLGIRPKIEMYVSDPELAIELLDNGCQAVLLLPESEVIARADANYRVVRVVPTPVVYMPTMVRIAARCESVEVQTVVRDYLLQAGK
jgi:DNA-binding transcriptional LysR family regulator